MSYEVQGTTSPMESDFILITYILFSVYIRILLKG